MPNAKRNQNFTPLRGRTQSHSLWRVLSYSSVLQKAETEVVFAKKVAFHQRSSRYHPVELMLAIIYALIAGIHRLNKTKILQGNGAFQQIILPAEYISKQTLDHITQKIEKMKPL